MSKKNKLTAEQVIAALEENQGLAAVAARHLGVALQTIYNYRDRYASVRNRMIELRERRTDVVEAALYKKIHDGDIAAIIFYMKTQGKSRGYVERHEISGSINARASEVKVYIPDNGRGDND